MLSPQQVIDTADGLTGLAAILSDPKAYEAKIAELKQYAQEGKDAFDKADAARLESEKALSTAQQLSKEANDIKESYTKEHDTLVASVNEQYAELEAALAKVSLDSATNAAIQKQLKEQADSLSAKESLVQSKLSALDSQQKDLDAKIADATSREAEYKSLIAKVKASVG